MKAYERLLSYVKVFTPSSEETGTSPSTQYQFDLARLLVQELKELGVKDADVDEHCYVYGHIPATRGYESRQKLGFIAHMDTVSDFCDHPVTPVITPNYDGKDLALGTSGRVLSPKMFPHLSTLKGRTLITSDGTTILGADDKAGIAEIMTIIEHLNDNTIPHGPLCIAFTPDEEIGMGPAHFDVKKFGSIFESAKSFPNKSNIEFVEIIDKENINMRVWERGSGITQACGTGACATAVAAFINELTGRKSDIIMDGGTVTIEWDEASGHILMTGPATKVFDGEIEEIEG